jgi:hypothetical protein
MLTNFVKYFKSHCYIVEFKTLWTTFIHGDGPLLLWALRQDPVSVQRTVRYRNRSERSTFTTGIILLALSCWWSWGGTGPFWHGLIIPSLYRKTWIVCHWFHRSSVSLWLKRITCSKTWAEFGFWCIQGWTGITCDHQLPKLMCIACLCEHMRGWR